MIGKKLLQILLSVLTAFMTLTSGAMIIEASGGCFEVMPAYPSNKIKADESGEALLKVIVDTWVDGDPEDVSLQWYEVQKAAGEESLITIEGETSESLLISGITEQGEYRCIGTDGSGYTSETVFYVYPYSVFEVSAVGETSRTVNPGATETLQVFVESEMPVTYEWSSYYSDIPEDGSSMLSHEDIEFDNDSDTFVLENIDKTQTVTVNVSNETGDSQQISFNITINNHLSLTTEENLNVPLGEPVTLHAEVHADDMEGVRYCWGKKPADGWGYNRIPDETGPDLTTGPIYSREEYRIYVIDAYKNIKNTVISVNVDNEFSAEAEGDTELFLNKGDQAQLSVRVSGKELSKVTYSWSITWTMAQGYIDEPVEGNDSNSFDITDFQEPMDVTCVAEDGFGGKQSVRFAIRLDNAFEAYVDESLVIAEYGDSVSFQVHVKGNDLSKVTYSWFDPWSNEENNTDTLSIENITVSNTCSCMVEDGYGNSEYVIVRVEIRNNFTAAAVNPQVKALKGNDVTLEVEVSADDTSDMVYRWYLDGGYDGNIYVDKLYIDGDGPVCSLGKVYEDTDVYCEVWDKYQNYRLVSFKVLISDTLEARIEYEGDDTIYLKPGETGKLMYKWSDPGTEDSVTWRISYFNTIDAGGDTNAIQISEDGTVTAGTKCGHGVIYCEGPENELCFYVNVYEEPESIHFYQPEYIVNVQGGGVELYTASEPRNAAYAPIQYSVEDESIAYTDGDMLYGKSAGTTKVIASYGTIKAYANVTVLDGEYADYIRFETDYGYSNSESALLYMGDEYQIVYELGSDSDPDKKEFADEDVRITVDDESVIQVDESGCVTTLAPGRAVVTLTLTNGYTAYVYITVSEKPERIIFRENAEYRISRISNSKSLENYVEILPEGASMEALTLESSDPSVISTYSGSFARLNIEGVGKTTITVTSKLDPSITASHEFEVYDIPVPTAMTKVPVSETVYKGYKYHLQVNYEPEDASVLTNWTIEGTGNNNENYHLDELNGENSNEAVLYIIDTGTYTVTATSEENPSLTQTFTFTAIEGDEPIEKYSRKYILVDPVTNQVFDENSEYTVVCGKKYILSMTFNSTETVPSNMIWDSGSHQSSFEGAAYEQIPFIEPTTLPSSGGGYGYILNPGTVSDMVSVLFTPTEPGSAVMNWRGESVRITSVSVYNDPEYTWSEDNSQVTAKAVSRLDESDVITETVQTESMTAKEPTCEEPGERVYTAKFTNELFSEQTKTVEIPALGHKYGEPTYEWSEDNSSVTAKAICEHDKTHVATETVNTTVITVAAECEKAGSATYTAVFTNELFSEQTKVVEIPALGHKYDEPTYEWTEDNSSVTAKAVCEHDESHVVTETVNTTAKTVAPECEKAGSTTYTAVFTNELFSEQTKVVEISALGHKYGEPTYEWTEDNSSVTAKAVCEHDESHVVTETVTTTKTVDATCEEAGSVTYTAVFTNELFSEQTKVVEIPALGHKYGEPTYEWAEDYSSATAKTVCEHDDTHVITETVQTTSETIPATETEDGSTIYTAVFTNELFTTQTKVIVIPATGPETVKVTGVQLDKDEITLRVGKSETLTATVLPENAEDRSVTWSSSDTAVAKVDQNGKVTAVADTGIAQPAEATITVTTNDGSYTAECKVKVEDPINAFVRRLYKLCFNRNADAGGFKQWSEGLRSGKNTAAKTVQFFFTSKEYQNLKLNSEDFVEMCYQVMMGRASDAGGKKNWLSKINDGVSDLYVLKGFVGSREFAKICADYGITVGEIVLTEPRDQNIGITQFVSRCYSEVLGRKADVGGLNNWCKKIHTAADKKQAAIDMASKGFFHSREYLNKNTTDDEYVKTLYRTFLGREADTGGYNNWMKKLASGTSRDTVLMGFANSAEFANIMAKYGIR